MTSLICLGVKQLLAEQRVIESWIIIACCCHDLSILGNRGIICGKSAEDTQCKRIYRSVLLCDFTTCLRCRVQLRLTGGSAIVWGLRHCRIGYTEQRSAYQPASIYPDYTQVKHLRKNFHFRADRVHQITKIISCLKICPDKLAFRAKAKIFQKISLNV